MNRIQDTPGIATAAANVLHAATVAEALAYHEWKAAAAARAATCFIVFAS
ncbi:MAG: hypothetical protein ABI440_12295 [Casimicrobiaceae bacterium]